MTKQMRCRVVSMTKQMRCRVVSMTKQMRCRVVSTGCQGMQLQPSTHLPCAVYDAGGVPLPLPRSTAPRPILRLPHPCCPLKHLWRRSAIFTGEVHLGRQARVRGVAGSRV